MRFMTVAAVCAGLACATPVFGADASAGKAAFRAQCALCHSAEPNDGGGAQGPNLNGVFGRHSAGNAEFGYTAAMKASGLTWNAATLDRFLAAPTRVVPGSAMVIPVPDNTERANIIAYFQAVKEGTFKQAPPAVAGFPPGPPPPAPGAGKPVKGFDDWKNDVPGRVHRIDLAALPAPYDTPSSARFPRFVPRPANADVKLPPGFSLTLFATDVPSARKMLLADNGDILISEPQNSKVAVLRPSADGTHVDTKDIMTFAQGLNLPYGLAFYPNARNPQWLYVAETNRVVRYAYQTSDTRARAVPEVVVPQLSPVAGGGHFTRDIAFSPDGRKMFVSVGSQSNVAEDMPKKSPAEVQAWEAAHGLGAAWGNEENRADVLVFDVGSGKPGKVYASGIRNCVSLTVQPGNGALWCTTNERDMLGDDLVPDYSTRVQEGHWYGWPWYYMGNHEDPRHAGERPDLAGKVTSPDVPYQAHSASLGLTFYTATEGAAAFPKEYVGDAFATFHGSWNRAFRTGHKVVRVRMKNGVPTGEYDDFLVGFIVDDGNAWGRPVGLLVNRDGSLLLSDDGANVIYRVAYRR